MTGSRVPVGSGSNFVNPRRSSAWQRREKLRRSPPRRRPPKRGSSAPLRTIGSEEEGFRATEAGQEKGRLEGGRKESCEEARREKGQGADEVDQASGETGIARADCGSCSHLDAGIAEGESCPHICCSLVVSDRVAALGGCRTLCGRAFAGRARAAEIRHWKLSPGFLSKDERILPSADSEAGAFCPKFFYCAVRYKGLIRHAFGIRLT